MHSSLSHPINTLILNCAGAVVHMPAIKVLRVKAPWMKNCYCFGDFHYIIPNVDTIVLGGTATKGSWDRSVSEADTLHITKELFAMFPALQAAPVVIRY